MYEDEGAAAKVKVICASNLNKIARVRVQNLKQN